MATNNTINTPFGTNVRTALGVNVGSAGAVIVNGGVLGTPSSGTLSGCSGLPVASGISGLGTGVATALAVNVGSAGAFVAFNGALGTPSSGTLSSCTGFPYDMAFNAGFDSAGVKEDCAVQPYGQLVAARAGSFVGESGYIDTAPTGAAFIVDILKNGTTIYTVKPQFAISANSLTAGTLKSDGTQDFVAGDRITFSVTQVGSTEPGEGCRFTARALLT